MKPLRGPLLSLSLLGCGALVATILVGDPMGVGVFAAALLLGALVVAARPAPRTLDATVSALLALALVATTSLITASWVLTFDLLLALLLASHAVAGGATFGDVARSAFAVLARLPLGMLLVTNPLVEKLRAASGERTAVYARGSLIAGILLVLFGGLFLSADRAFLQLTSDLLVPRVDGALIPARGATFVLVVALGAGLIAAGRYIEANTNERWFASLEFSSESELASRGEWLIPLVALNCLFAAFVTVQIAVLFGGRDHVLETTGLTFAQYARQGFFQLVAVALLTLVVIAGAVRWARIEHPRDRTLLRLLLGALCLLTLVVLASALKRLSLYEEVFGLTRLRISVHATILWLAGVFAMVLIAGARWQARWLARTTLYFTACSLLVFSLANPDALIARQNIDRFERTGELDAAYLATLSPDAWPVLVELPDDRLGCFAHVFAALESPSVVSMNLGRRRALNAVEERSIQAQTCYEYMP